MQDIDMEMAFEMSKAVTEIFFIEGFVGSCSESENNRVR